MDSPNQTAAAAWDSVSEKAEALDEALRLALAESQAATGFGMQTRVWWLDIARQLGSLTNHASKQAKKLRKK